MEHYRLRKDLFSVSFALLIWRDAFVMVFLQVSLMEETREHSYWYLSLIVISLLVVLLFRPSLPPSVYCVLDELWGGSITEMTISYEL